MRRLLTILAVAGLLGAFPVNLWAQANLPNNANAATIQGPDPTGLQGYPLAIVGAPGGTALNITGAVTGGPFGTGTVSTLNSTDQTLVAGATWVGAFEPIKDFIVISISIVTNQTSPGGGNTVTLQWSKDGVSSNYTDTFVNQSNTGFSRNYDFPVRAGANYLRVTFKNDSTTLPNPLTLYLQTVYHNTSLLSFPHFLGFGGIWTPFNANQVLALLNTASRTTQQSVIGFVSSNFRGAIFTLKVTAVPAFPGAGGLDLAILSEDATGSTTRVNSSGPRVTTTGTFVWEIYPGAAGTSVGMNIKQILSQPLPPLWGYNVTVGDAQAYTYSLLVALVQ